LKFAPVELAQNLTLPPRHTHTLLAPTPGAESVDGDDDGDDFGDDDFEGDFDDDGDEGYMMEGEDGSIEDPDNPHSGAKKYRRKRIRERQDQVDRRRERNRVLARKTRLRKKFFFESLQQQVTQLTSENDMLKGIVKNKLDSKLRSQILSECPSELRSTIAGRMSGGGGMGSEDDGGAALVGTGTPRGDSESPTSIGGAIPTVLQRADFTLITAIQNHQRSFVITDPHLPDNPIIFASQGFLDLCGFKLEEVLGRNCRFMQSPNADASQVAQVRDGIFKGKDVSACILNRRADGTEFYNQVFVAALHDANGRIANFVGVQLEVSLVFPFVRETYITCLPTLKLIILLFRSPHTPPAAPLHCSFPHQVKKTAQRNVLSDDLRVLDGESTELGLIMGSSSSLGGSSSLKRTVGVAKSQGRGDRLARRNSEKDLLQKRASETNLASLG